MLQGLVSAPMKIVFSSLLVVLQEISKNVMVDKIIRIIFLLF
ncbi:hypothetical protein Pf1_00571 [Flavobacterium columnare]|nr:hypothetical protein Pf1_00571 [Flavobacterium columnare]